ncbi:MAG: fructose bisphosphate aldolase [Ectothiorhodospiraceae bacterium AqS1]|nr:fructose bisphosphate aldolase [Ectothiorhodospiraceae bacterium AqS1]
MNIDQHQRMVKAKGFIAALDQSGGSTPKALSLYGIEDDAWSTEEEMYALIHRMRSRIITSEAFGGDRILGAILFEDTMDREIEGLPSAHYLWQKKRIIPFLKVDKGLEDTKDDVQRMKPMPELDGLLLRARSSGIFGTKMRSVIKDANPAGIEAVVEQQFEIGQRIADAGLVPIIEPEVDIHSPQKSQAEGLLRDALLKHLDATMAGIMLKLTLPEEDDFYSACIRHRRVLRVAALSGGYSREEANARLARNPGMIASFSRALTEGLSEGQSDAEFDAALDASIAGIFAASET